jgi:DNA excision repair protein ERCC-2
MRRAHPDMPMWRQSRRMSEAERAASWSASCRAAKRRRLRGAGRQLRRRHRPAGRRLIGAFVATLGLPQVNPVNEQLRAACRRVFGAGYDYTYLYPGMQKVVQAAGRVIRTEQDRARST